LGSGNSLDDAKKKKYILPPVNVYGRGKKNGDGFSSDGDISK
jgi:hypothetical protein